MDIKDIVGAAKTQCWIGVAVQNDFAQARNSRTLVEHLLLKCLRLRKGEYSPEEIVLMGQIRVFINATSTKCRAGEAWLDDVLASTREAPWTITPTPIQNVPTYIRDEIVEIIKKQVIAGGGDPEKTDTYIREQAKELKTISTGLLETKAQTAADGMSKLIQDQLHDANFADEFSKFRSDLLTYPYAVLKGPVVRNKKQLAWVNNTPQVEDAAVLCVERVNPFDFYWSPGSEKVEDGYVIQVMRMQKKALHACIGLSYFSEKKLRLALETYSEGHRVDTALQASREQLEQTTTTTLLNVDTIDVLDYWGSISGKDLKEWGVTGELDELKDYEVNVWVVDNICIRAVMNPDPMGKRPFYVSSYEKVPGQFVGRSPPMLMEPHQDIINSSYRGLKRNMGLASGPFAEVDQSRLGDGQAPEEITPGMIKLITPDLTGGGQAVYRFHNIESHASELLAVINNEVRACDDATGIPAYSYGNASTSGAGRTVGGLAMLMGNASKGIKKVIGHIERDILEPLIQAMYNYNMQFSDDETIKVDAQIVARGPTGIIMREAGIQKRLEALNLLQPYVAAGMVEKPGVLVLLREILRGLDMPVDQIIPDPKKQAELATAAQAVPRQGGGISQPDGQIITPETMQGSVPQPAGQGQVAMQQGRVGQGTTPMAVPDGRSGAANQVLQSNNNL